MPVQKALVGFALVLVIPQITAFCTEDKVAMQPLTEDLTAVSSFFNLNNLDNYAIYA